MKYLNTSKLSSLALTGAVSLGAVAMPTIASAELSSDLSISSMYLWRGQDVSAGNPAVSSSISYDFGNGFSVGTWASSEGASGSYEVDLLASYAGKVGEFGYSIGVADYLYPQNAASLTDSDITEYILSGSYMDFSLTAYINTNQSGNDDYKYYSLDYSMGKVGLHYGMTSVGTSANEYSDINVSYALTDNLTWTVSKAMGNLIDATPTMEDPLIMIGYSVPL
jgi:uncharacterized protein (TIGR02001 family)